MCSTKRQIVEIIMLDFVDDKFASFYGCEMLEIGGKATKVEGLLIFLADEFREDPKTAISLLNYTYKILAEQTSLTPQSLKQSNCVNDSASSTPENCQDILKKESNCRDIYSVNHIMYEDLIFKMFCLTLIVMSMLHLYCILNFIIYY